MAAPQRVAQFFGPVSATDTRLRYVDLSQWFAAGNTLSGSPSAEILPIEGDGNPLAQQGSAVWETGTRSVFVGPYGSPFISTGPRIALTLSGGTKGKTYTILVTFQDTDGQAVTLPVYQFVQWDAEG